MDMLGSSQRKRLVHVYICTSHRPGYDIGGVSSCGELKEMLCLRKPLVQTAYHPIEEETVCV